MPPRECQGSLTSIAEHLLCTRATVGPWETKTRKGAELEKCTTSLKTVQGQNKGHGHHTLRAGTGPREGVKAVDHPSPRACVCGGRCCSGQSSNLEGDSFILPASWDTLPVLRLPSTLCKCCIWPHVHISVVLVWGRVPAYAALSALGEMEVLPRTPTPGRWPPFLKGISERPQCSPSVTQMATVEHCLWQGT